MNDRLPELTPSLLAAAATPLGDVVDAQISTVSFSGGISIASDAGAMYSAPHWMDCKSATTSESWPDGIPDEVPNRPEMLEGATQDPDKVMSYPYSYTKDTVPQAAAYFATKNPGNKRVEAMGKAASSGCSFEFPRKDAPGGHYPATTATGKIVDDAVIHCFTTANRRVQRNGMPEQVSLDIQWTVWIDGQEIDAGISKHTIYVTWAPPPSADSLKSSKLETIFNLGCAMADGLKASSQSEQDAVFNAIWAEFGDRAVSRMDGLKLGYYKNGNPTTKNSQAYMLLADGAGDGQCNAFADLLKRSAALCGALSQRYQITAGTVLSGGRMLVKNWTFGTGTVPAKHAPFNYRVDTPEEKFAELSPGTGIPSQGHGNPQMKLFSQHFVVHYGTQCYDPSYGAGPFPEDDISKWEASALEGVTKNDTVRNKGDTLDIPATEIARKRNADDLALSGWGLAKTEK